MIDDPVFEALAADIHAAALDAEAWPLVLGRIAAALDGATLNLAIYSPANGVEFYASTDFDPEYEPLFLTQYCTPESNCSLRALAKAPPLTILPRDRVISERELLRDEMYNEIMRPQQLWHAMIANLARVDCVAPFGIMRRASAGDFSARETALLQRLVPHLNRAAQVFTRLHEGQARIRSYAEMLDRLPSGLLFVDAHGSVDWLNELAQVILQETDGLTLRDGKLRAANAREAKELTRLIAAAAAERRQAGPVAGGTLLVSRPSARRPLSLMVYPLPAALLPFGTRHAVAVVVSDPEREPAVPAEILMRLYGLTERQALVATLVVKGQNLREIAAELAVSFNTVRFHLKHILMKTGATRQSELVRILLTGPAGLHFK